MKTFCFESWLERVFPDNSYEIEDVVLFRDAGGNIKAVDNVLYYGEYFSPNDLEIVTPIGGAFPVFVDSPRFPVVFSQISNAGDVLYFIGKRVTFSRPYDSSRVSYDILGH